MVRPVISRSAAAVAGAVASVVAGAVVAGAVVAGGGRGGGGRGGGGRGGGGSGCGEQDGGQGGGHDRAGDQGDGELLQGGGQVGERAAGAAVLFGHGDREDAEAGRLAHEGAPGRRFGGSTGLEAAHGRDRAGLLGPVADGRLQHELVRRDGDRHGIIRTRFTNRRPGRTAARAWAGW
jgi:hypothetical protein